MAKDDGESRRQRLRELRELRQGRGGGTARRAGDDDRLDRASAERRRERTDDSAPVEGRPLERFPRLREALARRRQAQRSGDREQASGGPRGGEAAAKDRTGGRVMFARRLQDVPAQEGERDQAFKLERLERRIEQLRDELARNAEELRRLKQPQEPEAGTAPTPAQSTIEVPGSLNSGLEEEGQAESSEEDQSGKAKR